MFSSLFKRVALVTVKGLLACRSARISCFMTWINIQYLVFGAIISRLQEMEHLEIWVMDGISGEDFSFDYGNIERLS